MTKQKRLFGNDVFCSWAVVVFFCSFLEAETSGCVFMILFFLCFQLVGDKD